MGTSSSGWDIDHHSAITGTSIAAPIASLQDLGDDEDWLRDIAIEMRAENGLTKAYGVAEDSIANDYSCAGTYDHLSKAVLSNADGSPFSSHLFERPIVPRHKHNNGIQHQDCGRPAYCSNQSRWVQQVD